MAGSTKRIEITSRVGNERERRSEWAPYRAAAEGDESRVGSRFSGVGLLAGFLLFSGVTIAVARGHAVLAERYEMSPESLLGIAWMVQGAVALLCFVLAIRWLRS